MTQAEYTYQINRTLELISAGWSRRSIHQILEAEFDLTTSNSRNKRIKEAMDILNDGVDIEHIKELNKERLDSLYQTAIQAGKLKEALSAIDLSNKMNGIYNDQKSIKVSNDEIEIIF